MNHCQSGLDILLSESMDLLRGQRVGLVVNPTAVTQNYDHIVDRLHGAKDIQLVRLFGPEHGVRGDAQDMIAVGEAIDAQSGLPEISLYGHDEASLSPDQASLKDIDVLVYDIQDVGSRYYTYIYTLAYCMEAAAKAGVRVIVCDRPNPIGGVAVEGGMVDMAYRSFVGRYPISVRHGMTAGEMGHYFKKYDKLDVDLTVLKARGWQRHLFMDETGLPWLNPSPNMPTVDTALVYPGMCLVEGTNLSESRGTTRPFEWLGAPWVDPYALAKALNGENLPGVIWRPLYFRPTFHKFAGQQCGGVQPHVVDRQRYNALAGGIALLAHCYRLFEDFAWRTEPYEFISDRLAIDLLAGGTWMREAIEAKVPVAEILKIQAEQEAEFKALRAEFLLY